MMMIVSLFKVASLECLKEKSKNSSSSLVLKFNIAWNIVKFLQIFWRMQNIAIVLVWLLEISSNLKAATSMKMHRILDALCHLNDLWSFPKSNKLDSKSKGLKMSKCKSRNRNLNTTLILTNLIKMIKSLQLLTSLWWKS